MNIAKITHLYTRMSYQATIPQFTGVPERGNSISGFWIKIHVKGYPCRIWALIDAHPQACYIRRLNGRSGVRSVIPVCKRKQNMSPWTGVYISRRCRGYGFNLLPGPINYQRVTTCPSRIHSSNDGMELASSRINVVSMMA